MQSLEDYEREREAVDPLDLSRTGTATGIACPDCKEELRQEDVLFSRIPPLKRVTCPGCSFSKVVRA